MPIFTQFLPHPYFSTFYGIQAIGIWILFNAPIFKCPPQVQRKSTVITKLCAMDIAPIAGHSVTLVSMSCCLLVSDFPVCVATCSYMCACTYTDTPFYFHRYSPLGLWKSLRIWLLFARNSWTVPQLFMILPYKPAGFFRQKVLYIQQSGNPFGPQILLLSSPTLGAALIRLALGLVLLQIHEPEMIHWGEICTPRRKKLLPCSSAFSYTLSNPPKITNLQKSAGEKQI